MAYVRRKGFGQLFADEAIDIPASDAVDVSDMFSTVTPTANAESLISPIQTSFNYGGLATSIFVPIASTVGSTLLTQSLAPSQSTSSGAVQQAPAPVQAASQQGITTAGFSTESMILVAGGVALLMAFLYFSMSRAAR